MCAFLIMSNGWPTWYFAISPLPPSLSLCINQLPSHLMVTFHPSPGADQSKIRENVRDGVTGHQVWICRKGKRKPFTLSKTHQDWENRNQWVYFIVIEIYSLPASQLTCSLTQCAALYHHLTLESWDQKPGGEASLSQNLQGWKLASDESAQTSIIWQFGTF